MVYTLKGDDDDDDDDNDDDFYSVRNITTISRYWWSLHK
jgi:hypothetical protein